MKECKACESKNIGKKFLKKGIWLGAYRYDLDKYGELFDKIEFSLGTDYYPSCDLLHSKCKECGYESFTKVKD